MVEEWFTGIGGEVSAGGRACMVTGSQSCASSIMMRS